MRIRALGLRALELRDHLLVVQDRPGDQMREIGDEQRVMRQRVARDLASVGIDQERDLGEGVEGDADRQQDVDRRRPVENIASKLATRKPAYLKMPSTSRSPATPAVSTANRAGRSAVAARSADSR